MITLCGSTRFKKEFEQANAALTLQGSIVLSLGFYEKSEGFDLPRETLQKLTDLHYRKIDLADGILVIDAGGYIGEQTRREIRYAEEKGKSVRYCSEESRHGRCPRQFWKTEPLIDEGPLHLTLTSIMCFPR